MTKYFITLCLMCSACSYMNAQVVELDSVGRAKDYVQTILKRSEKVTDALSLTGTAKGEQVRNIVANRYFELNDIYSERDSLYAIAKNTKNKDTREFMMKQADHQKDSRIYLSYPGFLSDLSLFLNKQEIDTVKDVLTYNVVNKTYVAHLEMIPNLSQEEKERIMAWLKEAREFAVNAESSRMKHQWFGKYKGRTNNWLSKRGYNLAEERKGWQERIKSGYTPPTTVIDVEPGCYSIEKALQQSRERRRLDSLDHITLRLKAGTYRINQPIIIRPEDNNMKVVADGDVTISGGIRIEGWKKKGKMWMARVPEFNGRPLEFRQLWVNGVKAIRAKDVVNFDDMYRIRAIDKQKEMLYVPTDAVRSIVKKAKDGQTYDVDGEMVLHEMWCVANLRMKSIQILGDSAAITFHQPESHIHFMHPWPSPMITTDGRNSAFYLTNSKELLDNAGEWWLDTKESVVYYMPREGENMATATVEVPAIETLLKVQGAPDRMVQNIIFDGITFSHASWMRPSIEGHAPLQAGMYMIEAYKMRPKMERKNGDYKLDNQGWVGRPAAAVSVDAAQDISFKNCTFSHHASTGLDYHTYIKGGKIENCTFTDIGGNGIVAGSFGGESHEAHLPYAPSDTRETCSGLVIKNNLIKDVTNEDWGCVGIAAGFVNHITIEHNEICEVSYSGISLGWGWNRQPCSMGSNIVRNNLIHHYAKHMYDTAGIYTLGCQPGTFVEGNVIRDIYVPSYAHDPNHWFYLYTDEGSSYITVRNNWTPSEKFLQNANGPGNVWSNNGPMVSDDIKFNAGKQK